MSELETGGAMAAPEPAVIASTPTPEDTMAAVFDKHNPTERVERGDNGKFVSKTKSPSESFAEGAVTAEPANEINQEPTEAKPEPAEAITPKPVIEPPKAWSSEKKAVWSSLSPDAQEYIAQREGEAQRRLSELGEKATAADKFEALIDRHRQLIGQYNKPEQEIENLFQTKAALLRDPNGSIKWLADQLGVDLSQFAQAQNGEQPAENGQLRSLQQELIQLKRQLGETHNRLTAREQQEMQAREQSLASLVNDFSKDKDYWADIEAEVYNQIVAIKATKPDQDPKAVLEEAEKRAIKLNDEVSNKLTKAKREKEASEKAAEEKRKAEEAKRLASLNTKSSSGASPRAAKNIDAELEEIYDKMAARG